MAGGSSRRRHHVAGSDRELDSPRGDRVQRDEHDREQRVHVRGAARGERERYRAGQEEGRGGGLDEDLSPVKAPRSFLPGVLEQPLHRV
jgi:hypothetical protein